MPSSLGLYVEDNLIKYAKVSKNNNVIKVESFGMKFFEKIEDAIKQIVEETYSYKTPISVNLIEQKYNYFDVFSKLSQKDKDGIVKTNFENYCFDNGLNKDSFEQRFIYTYSPESKEKVRAIHIATPKTSVARRKNQLTGFKAANVSPIGIAVSNLIEQDKKQTSVIVNIEEKTTITKIGDNTIKDIKILPYGSKEVIEKINNKENSYSKAYEICKNTTIYTNDARDLQLDNNEYLEDIMPTLYNIVTEVRNFIEDSLDTIDKVYITGTLSVVNNIDIYFQDYLKNVKCEILKPHFVNNNSKINIKDYIEVNSAIAMALQSIDANVKNVNFLKKQENRRIIETLNKDVNLPKLNEIDFSIVYDKHKNGFDIATSLGVLTFLSYIIIAITINCMFNNKKTDVQKATTNLQKEIKRVESYNTQLNDRISEYKSTIAIIEDKNNEAANNKKYKKTIPTLMNNLMTIIPKEVRLESVENVNDGNVVIQAISDKYEQLAFFKTKIKTEKILKNVKSDTGVAIVDSETGANKIKVTIEGELP